MKKRKAILIILLVAFALTTAAQRTISGRITDAETGEAIPGTSVFIAGTTVGIAADSAGYYKLIIPGPGSYKLAASYVGYQPVFHDIESGKMSTRLDVIMNYFELEEVTVSAKVKSRKEDVNIFWETILGMKPTKNKIFAANPKDVFFYYNKGTNKLTVTCPVPIQIFNLETGYHIEYILKRFTHDYNTIKSSWEAQFKFNELKPVNIIQENTWEKNREKIYNVSIVKFIKSLYNERLRENGFIFLKIDSLSIGDITVKKDSLNRLLQKGIENYLTIDSIENTKFLYIPSDSRSRFALFCFGEPIKKEDESDIFFIQKKLKFTPKLNEISINDIFINELKTPNGPVQIFPDGSYKNALEFSQLLFSKGLTGLNMTLPKDFLPYMVAE